MSISSAGIGSGIDISGLVNDLIASEGQAKSAKFDADEADALARITSFGTLTSALSELRSNISNLTELSAFQKRTAVSSDTEKFTAIAESSAAEGSYSIEITQLAQNHKLSSADFANNNTAIGTGTLKFTIGSVEHSFDIGSNEQTLSGIKDKINQTTSSTGISATIVNTDTGTRLLFSSTETGTDNIFTVSVVSDADGNDNDNAGLSQLDSAFLSVTQAGTDASVNIDGAVVTSSSNSVEGAIDGITIDLLETNVGDVKTLTVGLDTASARANIEGFVQNYNALVDTINDLSRVNTENTENSGALVGDSTLRNLDLQLRRVLTDTVNTVPGGARTLAELGITTDRFTGKLQIDAADLNQALDGEFDTIGLIFAKEDEGIAVQLDNIIGNYIGASGIINTKTTGINTSINIISEGREQLERNLQTLESRLLSQFIAMDSVVSSLRATSDFLTQQLSQFVDPLSFRQ